MTRITPRKRHTLRRSEAENLKNRLHAEIGESADLFPTEGIEIVETSGEVTLFLSGGGLC